MRPQPLIAVTDVETSSRFYRLLASKRTAGKSMNGLVTGVLVAQHR